MVLDLGGFREQTDQVLARLDDKCLIVSVHGQRKFAASSGCAQRPLEAQSEARRDHAQRAGDEKGRQVARQQRA